MIILYREGLDEGEDLVEGLCRELKEETGARNISDIEPFGIRMRNIVLGIKIMSR